MARSTFSGPVRSLAGFEGDVTPTQPTLLMVYTKATLPSAATYVNCVIIVSDANTGVGTVTFSDGTSWIDVKTGLAVA